MRQIFDLMFVLCFFVPPVAVVVGAVMLAWPRHMVRGQRLEVGERLGLEARG
jgi:hypothetical protein